MTPHRLLPLLLIGLYLSQPALAQVNPFRGSKDTPLSASDITAINEATTRLLDKPQLVIGASEPWTNPQSGAKGTATVGSASQHKGLSCRVVQYKATIPGPRPERSAHLTWCKTKDGWRML